MIPSREIRSTPEEAAAMAALLARLQAAAALDPAMIAAELRPVVESIEARRRTCDGPDCGLPFLRQRLPGPGVTRDFCSSACRVAAHRRRYKAG